MEDIIIKGIELVVLIIAFLLGRYLIPFLKNNVDMQKLEMIMCWASTFVKYAENVIVGEKLGEEKLKKVTELLSEKAKELGVNLSDSDIRGLIEEAVTEMKAAEKND